MQTNDFSGFEALWQRVQAPSCPLTPAAPISPEGDAALLEGFMNREAEILSAYTALYRRWRSAFCAPVFHRAAKEAAARLRRLEAAYFLLCGDSFAPVTCGQAETEMPEAVRSLWLSHKSTAAAYERAAASAASGTEALCHGSAAQHRRQMETLFGIIQHFMQ